MYGVTSIWTFALAMGFTVACSPLEPIVDPEVSDLELTVDTLKTSLRDAQRTIAELRVEIDARRQELADLQIARAQLEGRVREAERRLVEARHVIDLQREELAGSRSERERVARTGTMLQNQLKQLQKQMSRMGRQSGEGHGAGAAPAGLPVAPRPSVGVLPMRTGHAVPFERNARIAATPAENVHEELSMGEGAFSKSAIATPVRVSVKRGDTLWSIAQRHRMPVARLKAINRLSDNHIQVGQALWLIEPAALGAGELDTAE
jgi:Tfp pilus assembly protein FimV